MKDVPTQLPPGTILPCYLPREETNDVFISEKYSSLSELPDGAVIGSASLRRQAQLMAMNPSFKVINFRGNVQTRLRKLREGKATSAADPPTHRILSRILYPLITITALQGM